MEEGVIENATAMKQQNLPARCYEKLSIFFKAFHFRRSGQSSPNDQGVSNTKDALRHMAADSSCDDDLADLITREYFSSLFIDGGIIGDTVLHNAARHADSNTIDTILNHGEFSGSKNFKEALCRKRNESGNTALHEAVMISHVEGVELLFSADRDVAHYPNKKCKSPLYLAIENRNKQIIDILFPSVSSFLYEHIWRQQQQSSNVATANQQLRTRQESLSDGDAPEGTVEKSHEIIIGLINEARKRELKVQEMRRQGQPSNSHLKLPLENYKAEEILDLVFYEAIEQRTVFNLASILKEGCNKGVCIFDIVKRVTTTGDTLLHVAIHSKGQEMVEFIAFHFPQLLTRRNVKGDTPLHVAAKTRSLHNMIIILTCYAKHSENGFYTDDTETLCRTRNEYGDTALHIAVAMDDVKGASLLLSADRVVAHYLNKKSNISPLCVAVARKAKELIDVLLHAPFDNDECHEGNSPLHMAILLRSGGLMNKLLKKSYELLQLKDQEGGNPLHCAASIGYLEGLRTLLEARPLSMVERNMKGYLPIHVAIKKGHLNVVEEFVRMEWFPPQNLLTLKGQNILHIAAKNGKHKVVSYILREKKLKWLFNEGDKNGNTPLHLASKNLFPEVLLLLTQDKRVRVNISNNRRITSYDIVMLVRSELHWSRSVLSSAILSSAGATATKEGYHLRKNKSGRLKAYWLKDKINTIMVVAILVATVTFAAGFAVPGGFINSDDKDPKKRGIATLVNRRMFQVFTICDTIAMYSCTIASFILLWSQFADPNLTWVGSGFAILLIGIGLVTMSVAFMAGLQLIVGSVSWLANVVTIIGIIPLVFFLFAYLIFIFPLGCRTPIVRHIGLFLCWISITLTSFLVGSYRKLPKKKKTRELEQQSQEDETPQVSTDMPET